MNEHLSKLLQTAMISFMLTFKAQLMNAMPFMNPNTINKRKGQLIQDRNLLWQPAETN